MKDDKTKVDQKAEKDSKASKKAQTNKPAKAEVKSVLVVSASENEPEFISQLEKAINEKELSVEERLNAISHEKSNALSQIEQKHDSESVKLQSQADELKQMKNIVHYYSSASKAFNMLSSENAKVEISIQVVDDQGMQRLSSTKLETAQQILSLFRSNAEERIKELIKTTEKVDS
ncbi:hypothetical protein AAOE16_18285 [Ekhidna sp. MALMAid0563]|uniref:hypothetical protein n=1 Tax=Ekhidna sp. MALMAid0563 TaxID=3143937 RepID=UPI0032DEE9FB